MIEPFLRLLLARTQTHTHTHARARARAQVHHKHTRLHTYRRHITRARQHSHYPHAHVHTCLQHWQPEGLDVDLSEIRCQICGTDDDPANLMLCDCECVSKTALVLGCR